MAKKTREARQPPAAEGNRTNGTPKPPRFDEPFTHTSMLVWIGVTVGTILGIAAVGYYVSVAAACCSVGGLLVGLFIYGPARVRAALMYRKVSEHTSAIDLYRVLEELLTEADAANPKAAARRIRDLVKLEERHGALLKGLGASTPERALSLNRELGRRSDALEALAKQLGVKDLDDLPDVIAALLADRGAVKALRRAEQDLTAERLKTEALQGRVTEVRVLVDAPDDDRIVHTIADLKALAGSARQLRETVAEQEQGLRQAALDLEQERLRATELDRAGVEKDRELTRRTDEIRRLGSELEGAQAALGEKRKENERLDAELKELREAPPPEPQHMIVDPAALVGQLTEALRSATRQTAPEDDGVKAELQRSLREALEALRGKEILAAQLSERTGLQERELERLRGVDARLRQVEAQAAQAAAERDVLRALQAAASKRLDELLRTGGQLPVHERAKVTVMHQLGAWLTKLLEWEPQSLLGSSPGLLNRAARRLERVMHLMTVRLVVAATLAEAGEWQLLTDLLKVHLNPKLIDDAIGDLDLSVQVWYAPGTAPYAEERAHLSPPKSQA